MSEESSKQDIKCGIIMPISALDGCSMEHWVEVKNILKQATSSIDNYNFNASIVSEADDIGVIQKRIIQNIYNSDIVICDVSGKNPNVMFELGMRLAFDKPTIIVKDDETDYSFDTGVIEHLEYPRDLRFSKIVDFKKRLSNKLINTLREFENDSEYSTFLKNFGQFQVANLEEKKVGADQYILDTLQELQYQIGQLKRPRIIRKREKYPVEPLTKAYSLIGKISIKYGATTLEEIFDECDLYRDIMNYIDAENFFPTEDEYKAFYNYVLRTCELS